MGRPENPIDPQAGPVQRFAYELRKLRDEAGAPAYRAMARRAGYSAATLSQAAAGERLPTLPVLLAYVEACRGDAGHWQRLWDEVEGELSRLPRGEEEDADPPYRGLARFEPDDAELFFGRGELTAQLEQMARRQRISALVGASGSGKSSLLRAGLLPRLRRPADNGSQTPAAIRILTPGARPLQHGRRLQPAADAGETWLLVDQFEELFTLCADPAERESFLERLLAAREDDARLRVVLAVRADFFGRCAEHSGLATALKDATLLVGPMNSGQYREAVVRPATAHGLLVEKDLTARIVKEVDNEPGALPLMSHALVETWRRRRGRTLTTQAYESAGGLHGAIARTAEDTYNRLSAAQAALARQILLRLIAPGTGTEDTHRPTPRTEFDLPPHPGTEEADDAGSDLETVLARLARARLLTLDDGQVLLAHEAVIAAWPRLQAWINDERDRLRLHRQLTRDAEAWRDLDHDPGALYRGTRLTQAEEAFTAGHRDALNERERAFLQAALATRENEHAHSLRAKRRSRHGIAALAVLCALALMTGTAAWQQKAHTDQEHTQAEARRIAALAAGQRTTDPVRAMRLSLAAWHLARTPETRGALLTAALSQRELDAMSLPRDAGRNDAQLSGDGTTLLYAVKDRIRRWDVRTHRELPSLEARGIPTGDQVLGAVSQDGRAVAVARDAAVHVYDAAGSKETALPSTPRMYVRMFSKDGRTLLLTRKQDVQLWDWRKRRLLFQHRLPGSAANEAGAAAASASPNGRYLAFCDGLAPLEVWQVAGHRRMPSPEPHSCADTSLSPQFTEDGRGLLTARFGKSTELTDIASGRARWRITHPGLTDETHLSADGEFVVSSDADEILVWRTRQPRSPAVRYPTPDGEVSQLHFDNGHKVIRYLGGGMVRTLSLDGLFRPAQRRRESVAATFSPDGQTVALAHLSRKKTWLHIRKPLIGSSTPVPTVEACSDTVPPVLTFPADGSRIACSGRTKGPLHMWDARQRRVPLPRALKAAAKEGLSDALFTPDGASLVFSDFDYDIKIWDIHQRTLHHKMGVKGIPLAVHPNRRLLVISSGGIGKLVDIRTRRVLREPLTGGDTTKAAFSPDGRLLAAADVNGRVTLWDGRIGRQIGQLPASSGATPEDGPEAISALAFAPDGKTLATAGDTGTVRLWDTASNQPLSEPLPTPPGDKIYALAFTPDGTSLHTVGRRTPLQSYPTTTQSANRSLCRRAHGGLTPTEWHFSLPDIPYRSTC